MSDIEGPCAGQGKHELNWHVHSFAVANDASSIPVLEVPSDTALLKRAAPSVRHPTSPHKR
eukprot:6189557-Pleurochrysis_carterae.AAC.1